MKEGESEEECYKMPGDCRVSKALDKSTELEEQQLEVFSALRTPTGLSTVSSCSQPVDSMHLNSPL